MSLELIQTLNTKKYHLAEVDSNGTIVLVYGSFKLADEHLDVRKFQRIRNYFGNMTVPNLISSNINAANIEVDDLLYTDTYWDDLRVSGLSVTKQGGNDPDLAVFLTNGSGSRGVWLNWFDKTIEEEVFFNIQLPHAYKLGTDINAHVHWVPKATGSNFVSWGLEYTWQNLNFVFGNTTIISGNQTTGAVTSPIVSSHYKTLMGTISGSGKTLSSMLVCRLFRDAAGALKTDNYDDDAGLLEIDFHYQIDRPGSREPFVK